MGTGLIFAAVIAVWVAYGVPLALRRYDEATRAGAVDNFSSKMRVLSHRRLSDGMEAEAQAAAAPKPPRPAYTRETARIAARRRRRTFLTLLGLTAVVAGLVFSAILPTWSVAIALGLVAAWLVACRVMVRSELSLAAGAGASAGDVPDDELTVVISGQVEDTQPQRQHVMEDVPLDPEDLLEQEIDAVPVMSTSGATLWDPVPVTLPTYVGKPRVARTIRTIEFGEPGAWTSGHVDGQEAAADRDGRPEQDHKRAVGD